MYQIITDSCCDQEETWLAAHTVPYAALQVHITETGETQTSAANPAAWAAIMTPILEAGKDILTLCFSSGLSATCANAVMAAEALQEKFPQRRIRVVDTLCASLGQGFLLNAALEQQARGLSLEELTAWAEEQKGKVAHWFTVDDLAQLRRGGRISAATAVVGTMLNVKPVLKMDETGHLAPSAKVRGRKVAISCLARKFADSCTDKSLAYIAHGSCPQDAEALAQLLKEAGAQTVHIGNVGQVIQAHTGPSVLALFYWGA